MFGDSDDELEIDEAMQKFLHDAFKKEATKIDDAPTASILVNNRFRIVNTPKIDNPAPLANVYHTTHVNVPSTKIHHDSYAKIVKVTPTFASSRDQNLQRSKPVNASSTNTRVSSAEIIEINSSSEESNEDSRYGDSITSSVMVSRDGDEEVIVVKLKSNEATFDSCKGVSVTPKPSHFGGKAQVRQRKFPGPAGLLPEKPEKHAEYRSFTSLVNSTIKMVKVNSSDSEEQLCSQNSDVNMKSGPFLRLSSDYDLNTSSMLRPYNVAWIKRHAKHQMIGRVPFLAALLKHIDHFSADPSVILEDSSGSITGTLHRDVVEKYGSFLRAGSALALKKMGIVSTGFPARRHHLNITVNNLIDIYDTKEPDCIRRTSVNAMAKFELEVMIKKAEAQLKKVSTPVPTQGNSSLFTSVLSSKARSSSPLQANTNFGNAVASNSSVGVRTPVIVSNVGNKSHIGMVSTVETWDIAHRSPSKVPRLSESEIAVKKPRSDINSNQHLQSVGEVVNTSQIENQGNLGEDEKEMVEGMFKGFDCSILFDDF